MTSPEPLPAMYTQIADEFAQRFGLEQGPPGHLGREGGEHAVAALERVAEARSRYWRRRAAQLPGLPA